MQVVEGIALVDDLDAFVAALGDVGDEHDCVVQAFDARLVAGRDHLATALQYAARAHERGDAIARDPAVETLLYAAGRRQIDRALAMGVDVGETPVVVLVASDFPTSPLAAADVERDCVNAVADLLDSVTDRDEMDATDSFAATDPEQVREFYDIRDREVGATDASLADLVRERVVLLSIDH